MPKQKFPDNWESISRPTTVGTSIFVPMGYKVQCENCRNTIELMTHPIYTVKPRCKHCYSTKLRFYKLDEDGIKGDTYSVLELRRGVSGGVSDQEKEQNKVETKTKETKETKEITKTKDEPTEKEPETKKVKDIVEEIKEVTRQDYAQEYFDAQDLEPLLDDDVLKALKDEDRQKYTDSLDKYTLFMAYSGERTNESDRGLVESSLKSRGIYNEALKFSKKYNSLRDDTDIRDIKATEVFEEDKEDREKSETVQKEESETLETYDKYKEEALREWNLEDHTKRRDLRKTFEPLKVIGDVFTPEFLADFITETETDIFEMLKMDLTEKERAKLKRCYTAIMRVYLPSLLKRYGDKLVWVILIVTHIQIILPRIRDRVQTRKKEDKKVTDNDKTKTK